jgi:hypothetical protein
MSGSILLLPPYAVTECSGTAFKWSHFFYFSDTSANQFIAWNMCTDLPLTGLRIFQPLKYCKMALFARNSWLCLAEKLIYHSTWEFGNKPLSSLLCSFPVTSYFLSLSPKYILSTLASNTHSLCSSLNMTDKFQTSVKDRKNYSFFLYFKVNIFGQEKGTRKTVDGMVGSSALSFFRHWILICLHLSQRSVLLGKPEGKWPLEIPCCRWKDSIKLHWIFKN